jgi:Ca2+-binding RTX toxin-like protein
MGRTRTVVVDDDNSWTIREELTLDPTSPTAPQDDFIVVQTGFRIYSHADAFYTQIVIWGVGLVSFGAVTAQQKTFMANLGSNPDLSAFPGDWVAFGFSSQQLDHFQYGVKNGFVYVTSDVSPMISFTPDTLAVTGDTVAGAYFGWDFGGNQFTSNSTSTSTLFYSDLTVTNGTANADTMNGTNGPETLLGLGGNDHLIGNGGGDHLDGGAGNDLIEGNDGNDRLFGGDGNDTLNGAAGDDQLFGGAGDDLIIPGSGTNTVDGGTGIDTVQSETSFVMNNTVENLELIGSAKINGTGNGAGNTITGNSGVNTLSGLAGNDTLNGLAGNDKLKGGAGSDTLNGGTGNDVLTGGGSTDKFVFDTALNATNNVDKLADFKAVDDTIVLDQTVFAKLATGSLPGTAFVAGTAAQDSGDRIIYDIGTGKLYYDADGNGSASPQILFAQLVAGTSLTAVDFLIVP